jgi:hypothetical protein
MEHETALNAGLMVRPELEDRIAHLDDWLRRIHRERRNAILKRGLGLIAGCVIAHKLLGGTMFPFIMVFAGGGGALLGVGLLNPLREATREVIALDDVRTLDVLLQARHAPDAVTRDEATIQVLQLLPRLRATDRNRLPASAVREITAIATLRQGRITLAALRALEYVGDATSRSVIREIARGLYGQDEYGREAQRILPALEARVEADRQKSMLLRPSSSVDEAELLRPASAHTTEPPEQLLRAVDEEPMSEAQTQGS